MSSSTDEMGPYKNGNGLSERRRRILRGRDFPKMQLMTVEELLEGKQFDTQPVLGRQ